MYADAEEIVADLNNNGGKYYLEYKTSGGSSHQTWVKRASDKRTMGIWSAPNHATYIYGEIFPFNLSRLLSRSEWTPPGTRMTLSGKGRDLAYQVLNDPSTRENRLCNRDTILAHMNKNPYFITGVYEAFTPGEKPVNVPDLVDRVHQRRLNMNHFIVEMIYADGPRPKDRPVYLIKEGRTATLSYSQNGQVIGASTDTEIAKQLSFMLLMDALNSQRDRFGPDGSNMEVMLRDDGSFFLGGIDNGGSADAANTVSLRFFLGEFTGGRAVSRFEKSIRDDIIAMDDFIRGRRPTFMNYRSPEELKRALGYEDSDTYDVKVETPRTCTSNHSWLLYSMKTRWDIRYRDFTAALGIVARHMRTLENNGNALF
jgi:hypothetical protein